MPNGHPPPDGVNPQNEIHVDPPHVDDPDDPAVFLQGYIQHLTDLEQQFAAALKRRFEAVGFTEVELFCDGAQWEFRASKVRRQDCQTTDQVRAAVAAVLRELQHEVDGDLILALVIGEEVRAAFRLRRIVGP